MVGPRLARDGRAAMSLSPFLAGTRARRLALALRGRDLGGQVKAKERRALKTARFKVRAAKRDGAGGWERYELGRASRRAAERLAAEFQAAGYAVTIMEPSE